MKHACRQKWNLSYQVWLSWSMTQRAFEYLIKSWWDCNPLEICSLCSCHSFRCKNYSKIPGVNDWNVKLIKWWLKMIDCYCVFGFSHAHKNMEDTNYLYDNNFYFVHFIFENLRDIYLISYSKYIKCHRVPRVLS